MRTYFLTANHRGKSRKVGLEAVSDDDAIVTGAIQVMTFAYPNKALWALGEITLTDSNGIVIKKMGLKTNTKINTKKEETK